MVHILEHAYLLNSDSFNFYSLLFAMNSSHRCEGAATGRRSSHRWEGAATGGREQPQVGGSSHR